MTLRLSVVLPVYNEADLIEEVLRELQEALPEETDIVAYDDGSTDETGPILDRLAQEGIRVIHGERNLGYDGAVTRALLAATGDLIHLSDSDGQHDPREITAFRETLERDGLDLLIGWKRPRRDPAARRLVSAAMNGLCRTLFRTPFHDHNCGFRLMRRPLRDALLPAVGCLPTFISTEMTIRAVATGFRVDEAIVTHRERRAGTSRSFPLARLPRTIARMFLGLLRLRRELAPMRPRASREPTP